MAHRLRRLRGIYTVLLHRLPSGWVPRRQKFSASSTQPWARVGNTKGARMANFIRRFPVTSYAQHDLYSPVECLSDIKSIIDEFQGSNHHFINNENGCKRSLHKNGVFLVFLHEATENSMLHGTREWSVILKKVKLLQQRCPDVNYFFLQCGASDSLISNHTRIIRATMEEFITFPILVTEKSFPEVNHKANGGCFLVFERSANHALHFNLADDIEVIVKAIKELRLSQKGATLNTKEITGDTAMQLDVVKEPCFHYLRNLLLSYPGCVSVDEEGNRIFLSDSNNHRIIISDTEGRILDCIGSSAGFEDGEFQFAKLFRPAASFYDTAQDCLYFIDSENHAIRKADMDKRVLETVYPSSNQKNNGVWTWIFDKLGLMTEKVEQSEQPDSNLINYPWHLIKTDQNDFIVIDRSFETLWVVSMVDWKVTGILRGVSRIIEEYGHMIIKKMSILKDMEEEYSSQKLEHVLSLEGIPYAGLFSSIANIRDNIIICDAAGQRVLKFHRQTNEIAAMQFSNLGALGLPYWMICPLETVFKSEHVSSPRNVHIQHFSVLPGRCNIQVNVDIPGGTELAAPLEEGCVWRQARGSGAELSGNGEITDEEKVGVAQQWFDELDNLAFSRAGDELELQIEEYPDINLHDMNKVHFDCVVNISPGTCELVVSAVLYLKLKDAENQRSAYMRILGCDGDDRRDLEKEASIKLLEETYENAGDIVFMKPLHLRLILQCADHPAGDTSNETISTDTTLTVSISLD